MRMPDTQTLQLIIEGCLKGRRLDQKKLYDIFARKMFGVCVYYTRDSSEAEDVLSEGFIKVFRYLGQYKGQGSFEGWVRRIMVNTALEKYRSNNRLHALADIDDHIEDLSVEEPGGNLMLEELMQMVQELSPQYRVVFNLYAIEGYNHKEIGEMLGISEGTSKSNLARARVILQRKVKERMSIPASTIRY